METKSTGQILVDYITSLGTACSEGVSENRISSFERRHGVIVPNDLRSYFLTMNGTAGDYAYGIIRFWEIDEIRSLAQELSEKKSHKSLIQSVYVEPIDDSDRFFVFADCMHEAQLYAVKLSSRENPNPVILLDGGTPTIVAESFSHFVDLYINNPAVLRLVVD